MEATQELRFRRTAGGCVFVALIIQMISSLSLLAGLHWHISWLVDPFTQLKTGAANVSLVRWGAVTDMLGYYLLLVPLFLAIGAQLRARHGTSADLFTLGGIAYALLGASAAAVLAATMPGLYADMRLAPGPATQAAGVVVDAVFIGVWGTLETIPLGLWALGTGVLLKREGRAIGMIGIFTGIACLAFAGVRIVGWRFGTVGFLMAGAVFGLPFTAYEVLLAFQLIRGRVEQREV